MYHTRRHQAPPDTLWDFFVSRITALVIGMVLSAVLLSALIVVGGITHA